MRESWRILLVLVDSYWTWFLTLHWFFFSLCLMKMILKEGIPIFFYFLDSYLSKNWWKYPKFFNNAWISQKSVKIHHSQQYTMQQSTWSLTDLVKMHKSCLELSFAWLFHRKTDWKAKISFLWFSLSRNCMTVTRTQSECLVNLKPFRAFVSPEITLQDAEKRRVINVNKVEKNLKKKFCKWDLKQRVGGRFLETIRARELIFAASAYLIKI